MMRGRFFTATILAAIGLALSASAEEAKAADPLEVIATIKPVHSLASAVMAGAGEPKLLIEGAGSPHSYALRPSDARNLSTADVVIQVSRTLETFLQRPIASLSDKAKVVTLSDIAGLKLLPTRQGGVFETHGHDHTEAGEDHDHDAHHAEEHSAGHEEETAAHENDHEHAHEHAGTNPHVWLTPVNAAAIADHLAATFAALRPEQAELFKANAVKLKERLAKLDAELKTALSPIREKPFIVFHDAYHYFEDHYGLNAAGSITLSPERQPGAARLREIRAKIQASHSVCVFSEPQFKPKLLETVTEGTDAKTAVLDPLGADLPAGADQYFELMKNLGRNLKDCLAGSS